MGNNDKPVIFCLHGLGSTSLSFIEVAVKDLGSKWIIKYGGMPGKYS